MEYPVEPCLAVEVLTSTEYTLAHLPVISQNSFALS